MLEMENPPPPLLSIITVTYKDPDGLMRTLASLSRTRTGITFPWEQVVVDSSPQENAKTLAEFSGAWSLTHIPQEPRGIYPAMNTGWRAAKGQILWFLNGGDEAFSGEALVEACGLLEANHSVELVSGGATLLRNGHVLYDQPPRAGLLPMLGINRVCQQQLLYRRSLLERLGGFSEEYRIAADYEFHLRAVHAGARQKTCNAVLVRFDRGGISSNISRSFEEFARIHRSLREKGQLKYGFMHIFVRSLELFRIRFLRILDDLGIGIYLRKIWHSFRRSIRK